MMSAVGATRRVAISARSTNRSYNLGCWLCSRNVSLTKSSSVSRNDLKRRLITSATGSYGGVSMSQSSFPSDGKWITPHETSNVRKFNTSSANAINWFTPRDDTTLWGRTLKKLGFTEIPKSVLMAYGHMMYMKLADELDYLKFFKYCNLPDTFASWFIVVELHVWLLSTRLMQDGKEGRIARNSLIKAMWEDNEQKSKKLEGALPAARRKEIQGLNKQFYAAMIGYDEGILGDDHVLAGALWRRFLFMDEDPQTLRPEHFNSQENHEILAAKVKALEMLVIYVRSQFLMLNGLSREQLLRKRAFKFVPFDDSLYHIVGKMEKSQRSGEAVIR